MTQKREVNRKIPEVRFPQFLKSPGWLEKKLGEDATFFKGKGLPKNVITPEGKNPCVHYGELFTEYTEVIESIKSRTDFDEDCFRSIENDVLMPTSDVTPKGLAKASCINSSGVILGGDILVIRTNRRLINGEFLSRQIRHLEKQVLRFVSGSTVFHLYASSIEKMKVFVPSLDEQQKLAACLSALDDLITAQSKKIEDLKAQKRGLIQQLFPANGETVPHLRFPEFLGAGAWEEIRLGDMLKETARPIKMSDEQDYGLVTVKRRYGGIVLREILKGKSIKVKTQFLLQENDFLISKRQIIHNACGLVPREFEGSIVSNEYSILKSRASCSIEYFNFFSQHPAVSASFLLSSRGVVIEKMLFDLGDWLKRKFLFPRLAEQRKIASCFSAIDELIAMQAQKLDALKAHKKGLMQGLFPAVDGVAA